LEKFVQSAGSACKNCSEAVRVECDVAAQYGYSPQWTQLQSSLMALEITLEITFTKNANEVKSNVAASMNAGAHEINNLIPYLILRQEYIYNILSIRQIMFRTQFKFPILFSYDVFNFVPIL
jgi:hypothetical protein